MDTEGVIQLVVLLVLLILSALYSGAETALTTVSELKLNTLAEAGDRKAARVLDLLDIKSSNFCYDLSYREYLIYLAYNCQVCIYLLLHGRGQPSVSAAAVIEPWLTVSCLTVTPCRPHLPAG